MPNAANALAEILSSYTVEPSTHAHIAHGFRDMQDLDAWRAHAAANDLLRTVDSTLAGMDAAGIGVEMFKPALPRWYAGVNFATTPWGTATGDTRPACSEGDLTLLMALGLTLDTIAVRNLDEDDRRALLDVLQEARELIEEDLETFPADMRHYLLALLLRAESVVRDLENHADETVRNIAFELGGAMVSRATAAQAAGDKEKANRWFATAMGLMGTFVGGVMVNGAGQLVAELALKQLGG